MNKAIKFYVVVWIVLLALFNVLAFVPACCGKFTPSFWTGYIFITLSFIGQIICSGIALRGDYLQKTFYKLSLLKTSYTGLILSFVFGGACMLFAWLPYWVSIVVCAIVLACNVISVLKASAAVALVSDVDAKVKVKTFFIRTLTVDAQGLVARAATDEIKAECNKVYEAVRYSDPMSHNALASVEGQITLKFAELAASVEENDSEAVKSFAKEIIVLLNDRNAKCKLLK